MDAAERALLYPVSSLFAAGEWSQALAAVDAAIAAGHRRSIYGVPLDFLRASILERLEQAARAEADAALARADRALEQGGIDSAQHLYARALGIPYIDPATEDRVHAAIERLETQTAVYARRRLVAAVAAADDTTKSLLTTIQGKLPNMHDFLMLCAVPRWLDVSIVALLRDKQDGRDAEMLERLSPYSFVSVWDDDRYSLSDEARLFYLTLWQDHRDDYRTVNRRLAEYFTRRLETDPPQNPAYYQRLVQAQIYHSFLSDPAQGVKLLGRAFQKAEDDYQLASLRQYVTVLLELEGQTPPEYFAYVNYAEGTYHFVKGNLYAADIIYRELVDRSASLTPDLAARVCRGLGSIQMARGQWTAALDNYHSALSQFQAQGNDVEAAETMATLGNAYLQIALEASGETEPYAVRHEGYRGIVGLGSFLVRLPLVVYLLWKLNLGWPLPNLAGFGRGLDWAIARLFGQAIVWFDRAEAHYAALHDDDGRNRVSEDLGKLYLALNHPLRTVELLQPVIALEDRDTFSQARNQLTLSEAWIELGQLEQAQELLRAALPIFTAVEHQERIAQTQTRLGYVALQRNDPEQAIAAYAAAFAASQRLGDPVGATDALHAMEHIAAEHALLAETDQKVEQAGAALPVRVYTARYVHPWLGLFQRIGIGLFFGILFLSLWIGVRTGVGARIDSGLDLGRLAAVEELTTVESAVGAVQAKKERIAGVLGAAEESAVTATSEFIIAVDRGTVSSPFAPAVRDQFLIGGTIGAMVGYLLIYTVLGIVLLVMLRLESLESQRARTLRVGADAVARQTGDVADRLVTWSDVRKLSLGNVGLTRRPVDYLSSFVLVARDGLVHVSGGTRHYLDLLARLPERLPTETSVENTGVSVSRSGWGWLFLGSLAAIAVYIAIIVFDPIPTISVLESRVRVSGTLYRIADVYSLFFVGAGLPLYFWLVVQPTRTRLAHRDSRNLVWVLTWGTVGLSLLAFAQFRVFRWPLSRPDILLPSLALFSVGSTLFIQRRSPAFWRSAARRVTAIGVAVILTAGLVFLLVQEMTAFAHLTRGNAALLTAELAVQRGAQPSPDDYKTALDAYARTLAIRQDSYVYYNQGIASVRTGLYEQAITAFGSAVRLAQSEPTYRLGQAISYGLAAKAIRGDQEKVARYRAAWEIYESLRQELAEHPARGDDTMRKSIFKLHAAVLYDLATTYASSSTEQAQALAALFFERSLAEYERFIDEYPDEPDGYIGRGWLRASTRNQAVDEEGRRRSLEQAIEDYQTAVEKATALLATDTSTIENTSVMTATLSAAYDGLGWSHRFLSELLPGNCIQGFDDDPALAAAYVEQIESALAAFTDAIDTGHRSGSSLAARAQLYYQLAFCGSPESREQQIELAVRDYMRALSFERRSDWYRALGDRHQDLAVLALERSDDQSVEQWNTRASDAYLNAVVLDPESAEARDQLRNIFGKLGRTDADLIDAILSATGQADADQNLIAFAQHELARDELELATEAVQRVLARSPNNGEAAKVLALILVRQAQFLDGVAREALYARAMEAAQLAIGNGVADTDTYLALGRATKGLGRLAAARVAFERARALQPDNFEVLLGLGEVYLLMGDADAARTAYTAAGAVMHSLPDEQQKRRLSAEAIGAVLSAHSVPADVLAEIGLSLARNALAGEPALPTDAAGFLAAGQAALDNEQFTLAALLLVQAVALDPQNESYWTPLRNALILGVGAGQVPSAEPVLTLILADPAGSDAEGVQLLIQLAEDEFSQARFGLAAAALERALGVEPTNQEVHRLLTQTYYDWGSTYRTDEPTVRKRFGLTIDTVVRAAAAGIEDPEIDLLKDKAQLWFDCLEQTLDACRRLADLGGVYPYFRGRAWNAYLNGDYMDSIDASSRGIVVQPKEARHYFNRGLAYVARGLPLSAERNYLAGIKVANAPENATNREPWLREGLDDLRNIQVDPADSAARFIEMLQAELETE